MGGGGGGVDRAGGAGGGRGADVEGGGGGGAAGLVEGGGGGGAGAEGFLEETGGGGGFDDPGNGGGARGGASGAVFVDVAAGFGGAFRRLATSGLGGGGDSAEGGGGGGRAPGGLGAAGGFGAGAAGGFVPESERYGESRFAPVSTPPRLRNFGIPPAKSPPSWGAEGTLALLSCPGIPSLLLRSLFAACPDGTGGASPVGGFAMPGTGGAPATGGPEVFPPSFETSGADLSFVTAFFSRAPFEISERSAP